LKNEYKDYLEKKFKSFSFFLVFSEISPSNRLIMQNEID
jgi:hypothetical protein